MSIGETKFVERALLRRNLLKNIDIRWNKRFVSYEIIEDGIQVHFDDDSIVQGSLLVGCDGARSSVRAHLIPDFRIEDTGTIQVAGRLEQTAEFTQIKNLASNSLVQVLGDQGHSIYMISTEHSWFWSLAWSNSDVTLTKTTHDQ